MNAFVMMLGVTACYTITSFSDKYAVSKAKFSGNDFTFLMCSSLAFFTALTLPFQDIYFTVTWQSFAAILLIAVCKMLEFQMNALVLKQLSAFELKAWIGVTLFASYITDVFFGADINAYKILCIAVTVVGLALIVRSGRENKIEYRKIAVPLVFYLIAKYGYGLIIRTFTPFASPTMQFMPALALVALIMLAKVKPSEIFKNNRKGALNVILARIPNTIGMLLENAVIAVSLANYSFIQPMILISLFVIGIIRRERYSALNLAGSIICIAGVVIFQLI
ncbi:MAG: hypothetical protein K2H90_01340 [Oscillospiraceae bacterium]|nr:hypothetical protein [Oscillospiraceae bacterium]